MIKRCDKTAKTKSTAVDCFYRAMHYSAKHGLEIACRLSVCLSVYDVGGS